MDDIKIEVIILKLSYKCTKQCTSKAIVFQILIDKQQLVAFDAASVQLHEMRML